MTDWIAAIRGRRSVRRYRDVAVPPEALARLRQVVESARALDAGVEAEIALVPYSDLDSRSAVGASGL